MKPNPTSSRAGEAGRSHSIAKRVARMLEQQIVAGTLAAGVKIAEQATAERLGVSRVPVREALVELERAGLVVRSATGRLRVQSLAEHDMDEILDVRRIIEPAVMRAAAERRLPQDVERLERNLSGLAAARDLARISLLDAEFHDLVAAASHQPRLMAVWSLLRGQFLLWIAVSQRRLVLTADDIRRSTLAHHAAMLTRIRSRDADGAERYARDLLRSAAAFLKSGRRTDDPPSKPRKDHP
jgi:DNA-binding GntR family transcriptional regulator